MTGLPIRFKSNHYSWQFLPSYSVLVAKLCLTLCHPMDCSPQAPWSMEFSRQEYWSGLTFPPPADLPNPGTELASFALAGGFFTTAPPRKPISSIGCNKCKSSNCRKEKSHLNSLWRDVGEQSVRS